jgi:O-antigen ligase
MALHTLGVAAAAGIAMFCIEVLSGGRVFFSERNREVLEGFTDFRGVRYLDTYQAFNIMLASCLIAIRPSAGVRNSWRSWSLAAMLAIVALWTRNRAAVVALLVALVAVAILQRRFRLVIMTIVGVAVSVGAIALLSDSMMQQISHAFAGVLNPVQDDTGRWRLFLQLSAIEQGLKTPFVGQGYGGYYYFEAPGMEPILAPPHNQYIELFLKAGLVGLGLCLASLWTYASSIWRAQLQPALNGNERLVLRGLMLVIVAVIPYGLAYDFPPIFPLMLGCGELILQRLDARQFLGPAELKTGRNPRLGSVVPT